MELRVLRYFLAVAQAESISGAAEMLHLTQPTLSRQLMDLEISLGTKLFNRGRRGQKVTLTEEGMFLRKRAEEIITLADRTRAAFEISGDSVAGDVYIGAGETDSLRILAQACNSLQKRYPHIHYHITSGDMSNVEEMLEQGLIDFGVLLSPVDGTKYEALDLPHRDTWGVIMRTDAPLAKKERVRPKDLWDKPLIWPRQTTSGDTLLQWIRKDLTDLNIVADYSLVYNASLLADEGLGYTLALDKLINVSENSSLCFRPLEPSLETRARIVWKKKQVFSRAASLFLNEVHTLMEQLER